MVLMVVRGVVDVPELYVLVFDVHNTLGKVELII
jgi:hypothetical protein